MEDSDGGRLLKVSVKDTGVGIAEADHDKLFKLFGFLKDNRKVNVGIGLGLMISQKIMK